MKKRFTITMLFFFASISIVLAQTVKVTGTVTSGDDGEPIIGATILVKGTSIGTITDLDGNFSLDVPEKNKILQISYVGMSMQEVAVKPHVVVVLQSDVKHLEEVVVTAMGISREKRSLGYAIQEVGSEELTKAAAPSLTSSLSGKVAGVQVNQFGGSVGASSRISVRGNSSLSADQQPLIVVDGVPISNDTQRSGDNTYNGVDYGSGLNDINPEDIESISVLKGGSAALYGMRAGNGVILITTKSGKGTDGVTISYDGSITFDRISTIPKLQNSYGQGYDGDEYHYGLNGNGLSYQDYASRYGFSYLDGAGNGVNDGTDESWGPRLDAGLNLVQFDSNGEATPWVSRKNNVKDFFQTGTTQNHTVSVQSRSEKMTTRASLSYRNQIGTVPNTDQKKYSGQVNTNMKLNKYISYDLSASYTRTQSDNLLGQGYANNNPINSLVAWSGRQINMQSLKNNWDQKDVNGDYTYYNWNSNFHMNPYFTVNENTNSYQRDRIFGKSSLYYQPFEWLKFEGRVGVDYYHSQSFERHYFDFDNPDGAFLQTRIMNTEFNADFIASANKTFGDFNITGLLGANYRDVNWEKGESGASALTVPGVYTLSNKSGDAIATMDHSHIRSNSIYANVSLGWKHQLYVDASARNDWSSTIHDAFFYPSVSLSWIPTESFPELTNDIFSFWKLRGGIAQVGSATSAYRNSYYYYPESSYAPSHNGVSLMHKSYTYPNEDLKPEKVTTWEIGTEIGLLNNRLHLDLAYYQKKTEDQILSVTTSNVVGFSSMLVNAGRIDNKGVELQLKGDVLQNKEGLNWTSTLNFSKDRSEVKSLYEGLNTYNIGWTWGIGTYATVGEKWGDLMGTGYNRVTEEDVTKGTATSDQIGAVKVNSSGAPYQASSQKLGNVTPDFLMGWRNDFAIKQFGFGIMFDLRIGGDIWSQTMNHGYTAGVAEYTVENGVRERAIVAGKDVMTQNRYVMQDAGGNWVENTIETDAQTWFEQYGVAEDYVFKGSYLKLRELYVSYEFPKRLLAQTRYFSRATISFVANNVALLWVDKSNTMRLDPEAGGVSSDSRGVGFEQASVPSSRSFGIKVGLTF